MPLGGQLVASVCPINTRAKYTLVQILGEILCPSNQSKTTVGFASAPVDGSGLLRSTEVQVGSGYQMVGSWDGLYILCRMGLG